MTTPATVPAIRRERPLAAVTPSDLEAAARVFAREIRAHVEDGLAHGRLAAVLAAGRQAEHLVGLLGLPLAGHAFAAACQEPEASP